MVAQAVTLTPLTGLTGGSTAFTAVFRGDLDSEDITQVLSITIADDSFGLGGAPGQFTGFDLDAIKLSTTFCTTAACAATATALNVFDFFSGVFFTPGSQRAPADLKLFGTGATGSTVDNDVATLGFFDANSTSASPFGFVSMGDNGVLTFNLTEAVSTAGLYLYIGEVGDNGEVAASTITLRDTTVVPLPATVWLLISGMGALAHFGRRRRTRQC